MIRIVLVLLLALCAPVSAQQGQPTGIAQIGPAAWTPADASGASLVFTGVSANYVQIGNMVFAYASITYPATANGSAASISGFPVAFPASSYSRQCTLTYTNVAAPPAYVLPTTSSSTAVFATAAGAATTNVQLSGAAVIFMCVYPAS